MNSETLEKYSSAITLSDMEIFVFPELMYSLLLANMMSPIIWSWREADCFVKLEGKSPYKKLLRLKQFIMDEYDFNLDLNTWGLTNKDVELNRFKPFISPDDIANSNALFGYHGDEYYFDVDIRRHFGLDKYEGDIIPYWKTETVEAMTAFRFKDGYQTGAGECVSLAALYAAAAFIVCQIPLEDIYMILTPLHSQNFLDINDGVLTNNRRIVTKNMWFNGTALTMKAQRALRNEQVTIVAHNTGCIHCFYDHATIDPKAYDHFRDKLTDYLTTEINPMVFASFLRCHHEYQEHFQFCTQRRGEPMFVKAEVLYHYEHGSPYQIGDASFNKLLLEVDAEDYSPSKVSTRLCCDQLMAYLSYEKINITEEADRKKLTDYISSYMPKSDVFVEKLRTFVNMQARLPKPDKQFTDSEAIHLSGEQSRQEIIEYLSSIRHKNQTADLAFYAYRDMDTCDWQPFLKAAIERCPVSIETAGSRTVDQVYNWLGEMTNNSIYDGNRLAQPDEVVNYGTGDGIEKAITLANIIHSRETGQAIQLEIINETVILKAEKHYTFTSAKKLKKTIHIV